MRGNTFHPSLLREPYPRSWHLHASNLFYTCEPCSPSRTLLERSSSNSRRLYHLVHCHSPQGPHDMLRCRQMTLPLQPAYCMLGWLCPLHPSAASTCCCYCHVPSRLWSISPPEALTLADFLERSDVLTYLLFQSKYLQGFGTRTEIIPCSYAIPSVGSDR